MLSSDEKRELLRHTVATLAYRGAKAISDAPPDFKDFRVADHTRTPGEILAHIGDLLDWALSLAIGKQTWHNSRPLPWEEESDRFYTAVEAFDAYLATEERLRAPVEKLFQGPIADALTHVGQIAMLRRMAGRPMRGENYYKAEIQSGRVGADQSSKRTEFD